MATAKSNRCEWTGSFVRGATISAVVKYHAPTNLRGSRWIATIIRGRDEKCRAAVPFSDGPMVAALNAAAKGGCSQWTIESVHFIDDSTYCVGFAAA